jgi:hypothetical protein
MKLDGRPLLALLSGGSFLLLLVTAGLLAGGRGRPTDLRPCEPVLCPTSPAAHPGMAPRMNLAYLAIALHGDAPDLRVARPQAAVFCYVATPDVDPANLDGLSPTEEYADCWRGVVLCEPDQPTLEEGPHACRAAAFYLFGDLQLMERVKASAERIQFGPFSGVGGPVEPPPAVLRP